MALPRVLFVCLHGAAKSVICEQDLSHKLPDAPLPEPVATGAAPFLVVGAMAGGSR